MFVDKEIQKLWDELNTLATKLLTIRARRSSNLIIDARDELRLWASEHGYSESKY